LLLQCFLDGFIALNNRFLKSLFLLSIYNKLIFKLCYLVFMHIDFKVKLTQLCALLVMSNLLLLEFFLLLLKKFLFIDDLSFNGLNISGVEQIGKFNDIINLIQCSFCLLRRSFILQLLFLLNENLDLFDINFKLIELLSWSLSK